MVEILGNNINSCLFKEKILVNIKYLDSLYTGKYLNIEDLDERFFLRDRKAHFTPSKFTPFAKPTSKGYYKQVHQQNKMNQSKAPFEEKSKTLNSHRVLNYECPPP